MIEETRDIVTAAGQMETFICWPERGRPFPAVFLLMDAPGIREELRDMARRLATVGYHVLLPNLYYRAGRDTIFGPDVLEEGSPERQRMRAVRTRMTIPPGHGRRCRDAGLYRLSQRSEARPGRMPRVLHERPLCPGGGGALPRSHRCRRLVLRDVAGQRRAGEPASLVEQGRGELYIACAEHDALAPLPMVDELRTLFVRAGTAGEIELYPGVHHGFAFPQRWCYDKPAAERHWERLIALYRRRLG